MSDDGVPKTMMRFTGDPETINEIAGLIRESGAAESVRVDTEEDTGVGSDFALETVAAAIAILSTLFFDRAIVPSLWQLLRKKRPGTKVVIETPTRTVSIVASTALTEDELRAILAPLLT